MVQTQPNLALTLKHLAPCGAVLPSEALVALDHSLPLKRADSGLRVLNVWGRLLCANGKDYIVAEGYNTQPVKGKAISPDCKYFFSQDGARWADLPVIGEETAAHAAKLRSQLSGDPAHQYVLGAAGEEAAAEGGGEEGGEGGGGGAPKAVVTEVQRLRAMIDGINALTDVVPKRSLLANAHNELVANRLFGGLDYPSKLESYTHRAAALDDKASLAADDVRGAWSLLPDAFTGTTLLRSLLAPGYCFYFNSAELTWGGLYVGDGLRNNDLVFML